MSGTIKDSHEEGPCNDLNNYNPATIDPLSQRRKIQYSTIMSPHPMYSSYVPSELQNQDVSSSLVDKSEAEVDAIFNERASRSITITNKANVLDEEVDNHFMSCESDFQLASNTSHEMQQLTEEPGILPECRNYCNYPEDDMSKAINYVLQGKSIADSSRQWNVPYSTLYARIKKMGRIAPKTARHNRQNIPHTLSNSSQLQETVSFEMYLEQSNRERNVLPAISHPEIAYYMRPNTMNLRMPSYFDDTAGASASTASHSATQQLYEYNLRHPGIKNYDNQQYNIQNQAASDDEPLDLSSPKKQ